MPVTTPPMGFGCMGVRTEHAGQPRHAHVSQSVPLLGLQCCSAHRYVQLLSFDPFIAGCVRASRGRADALRTTGDGGTVVSSGSAGCATGGWLALAVAVAFAHKLQPLHLHMLQCFPSEHQFSHIASRASFA